MNFIDIRESAFMAIDTVRTNKLRSALTILGVSVGVVTVIFMVGIIQGLNRAFAAQIESLGSNTIWATKFDPSIGHQPTTEEIHRKELTIEDANAIRREAPSIVGVSPFYRKINETARYRDKQSDTPILIGVTPYHEFTTSSFVGRGRYVTELDVEQRTNIAVLGQDLVKALFPGEDPIDKEFKIAGRVFRVVGVMEPLGSILGQSRDNTIYIPITTFEKYYPDIQFPDIISAIIVRPISRAYVKSAMDEMTDILRRQRHVPPGAPNNFGMSSQDALLDIYNQLTGAT
jgi:putative ABC transport system permease protein